MYFMLFFRIWQNCFRGLVKDIGYWTEDILAVVIKLALLGLAVVIVLSVIIVMI